MSYLPTRCDVCSLVCLVPEQECLRGEAACPDCSAPTVVLPGCAYAASALPLFEDLRSYVRQAELSVVAAGELVLIMDRFGASHEAERALSRLSESVPALGPLLPILLSHPAELRQALSMLSTLISERAYARVSGMIEMRPATSVSRQRG